MLTIEATAVLLMQRNLKMRLDILKPNIWERVEKKQQDQELQSSCELGIGQTVVAQRYQMKEKWVPRVITAHSPPFMSDVEETPTISRDENSSLNTLIAAQTKL